MNQKMKVVWKYNQVKQNENLTSNQSLETIKQWIEWTKIHKKIQSHFDQEKEFKTNNINHTKSSLS